jgi:hypothetical protein
MFYFLNKTLLSFIQAMAVYKHLSKNNDVSTSPDKTDKSAEYFSDNEN